MQVAVLRRADLLEFDVELEERKIGDDYAGHYKVTAKGGGGGGRNRNWCKFQSSLGLNECDWEAYIQISNSFKLPLSEASVSTNEFGEETTTIVWNTFEEEKGDASAGWDDLVSLAQTMEGLGLGYEGLSKLGIAFVNELADSLEKEAVGVVEQVPAGIVEQVTAGMVEQVSAIVTEQVTDGGVEQVTAGGGEQVTAGGGEQVTAGGVEQVTAGGVEQVTAGGGEQVTAGVAERVLAGVVGQGTASAVEQEPGYFVVPVKQGDGARTKGVGVGDVEDGLAAPVGLSDSGAGSRGYSCSYCGASGIKDRFNLLRHISRMHSGSFVCSICTIEFYDRYSFNVHCVHCYHYCPMDGCSFKEKRQGRMEAHIRKHCRM